MDNYLYSKLLLNKNSGLVIFIGLYLLMGFLYHLTLWMPIEGLGKDFGNLISWAHIAPELISYGVMLLVAVPIWLLIFKGMKGRSIGPKLMVHVVALPLFVYLSVVLAYMFKDYYGTGSPTEGMAIKLVYAPAFLYLIQFGLFHAWTLQAEYQEKERKAAVLKVASLQSELAAIKSQLDPHFLHNVFNTISASVPSGQEHTREMIAKLSGLFRYQMRASQNERVPLRGEIDFINMYLQLEKERFGERLSVEIDIPQDLLNEEVPPMILQPLVDNAIKHGLSSLIEGGKVEIRAFRTLEGVYYEVVDNGVGVANKEVIMQEGGGLHNTQVRLEEGFGSKLMIEDNEPRGLRVGFVL